MTARPMSEETPEQLAQRVVDTWGDGNPPIVVLARALLSTSAAVRGMREALESEWEKWIDDGRVNYPDHEVLESLDRIRAALSGIEPGEDEQARGQGRSKSASKKEYGE